jgi:hypothetical protein
MSVIKNCHQQLSSEAQQEANHAEQPGTGSQLDPATAVARLRRENLHITSMPLSLPALLTLAKGSNC